MPAIISSPSMTHTSAGPTTKLAMLVIAFAGLGGFLYGFDIGVISGAIAFMQKEIGFSATDIGLVVASVLYGGAVATFFSGSMADRMGRRWSINLSALVFIAGTIIVVFASNFAMILGGRLIEGLGVGIITIVVPLYLAETLPAKLRGRGIALFQLCLTFGILIGYVVNLSLKASGDWRIMFGVALIPAVVFLAGGLFVLPRSPRWLYVHGHEDEARDVLAKTQGEASVDASLAEMKTVIAEEKARGKGSWRQLLRPGYRKAFLIALGVGIFTQLTGINVLLQFAAPLLKSSGLHVAILGSVGIGLVNFVVTAIALLLVDKLGRRPLLIFGTTGIVLSLAFVGFVQLLFPGTALAGYGTLGGFMAFVVFYAAGPGIVVWLAISEVMPLAIRAKGMSVALCANSLTSALLGNVFMYIVVGIGYSGLFLIFASCTVGYLLIAIFALPETKGRSLEEIENELFKSVRTQLDGRDKPPGFSMRSDCTYTTKCFWICLCTLIAIDIILIIALTSSHMPFSFAFGYCSAIVTIQLLVAVLIGGVASVVLKSFAVKTFLVTFALAVALVAIGKIGMNRIQNGSISTASQIHQPNYYQTQNKIVLRPTHRSDWLHQPDTDAQLQRHVS